VTPQEFTTKWSDSVLKERAGAQEHFIDLCRMLGEQTPAEADPTGEWYAFEKGAMKTGGGDGWADVWKRGCFAWEYKGKGKDLGAALKQLKLYQGALDNPPLLIVSDMEKIEIHTAWTNMVQEKHVFTFDDLIDGRRRSALKKAFSETAVEDLKPGKKRADLTADVAKEFVTLAQNLRERGHPAEKVAHFVNRMVFCMFAEDVDLLPDKLFKRMLEASADDPGSFVNNAQKLFAAMAKPNGKLDFRRIEWFNGGLFDDDGALPLTRDDIKSALKAANQDWSNIDPSIMGTLFERGLDPDKRSQLGAHYTDPEKIMMIVNPVIIEPLTREWEGVKAEIEAELDKRDKAKSAGAKTQAFNRASSAKVGFLERLKRFRILDPACGSGNFLYLGLKALKDIEHRVNTECEAMGLAREFPGVGPENTLGIEINPFAAELARVSVWIGEIQWMREHGFDASRNPILKSLDNIMCHDALLNEDGTEYAWPAADAIIGNPPFLGAKWMLERLGQDYTDRLRDTFADRMTPTSDLVAYWFEKARAAVVSADSAASGFVATNMIRAPANRSVMNALAAGLTIYSAWSDEPWVVDGADVRVSIVCFARPRTGMASLDGRLVLRIFPDLSGGTADLTKTLPLSHNQAVSVRGIERGGAFHVAGEIARLWISKPLNPNNRPNADVVKRFVTVKDLLGRSRDLWIIDFTGLDEAEAALFEPVFAHAEETIKSPRAINRETRTADNWWRFRRSGEAFQKLTAPMPRFIATGLVTKHRFFVWVPREKVLPDTRVVAIARDDDCSFGILSSSLHEMWTLNTCQYHGVGNDPVYTTGTCFETFPFPGGLTPNIPAADYAADPRAVAIAAAAKRLNELRENWLNPADLVQRVPEVVSGYPDRVLPVDDKAAAILKKRTLTNLYNERPSWLDHAHRDLDKAVAAAYGWVDWGNGLSDDLILDRLFKLNQERAAAQR
jgi:type II restriction/modification system DNA methylase subunit YeeA